MSCGCDNSGDTYNSLCNADTPYPIVSPESVPSLIANLTKSLYGTIQKDVSNGAVQWVIPCDPSAVFSIPGYPRGESGLLCYLLQVAAGMTPATYLGETNAPRTFSEADMGGTWMISAASAQTVNLPQLVASSVSARRKSITLYNASPYNLTVVAGAGNTIAPAWNVSGGSSITLLPGDTVTLAAKDNTSSLVWIASGNFALKHTSQFAGTPSVGGGLSGFQFLPTGLVINWCSASFSGAGIQNYWPVAFPNALLGAVCAGQYQNARVTPVTGFEKTKFYGISNSVTTNFVISIGY